MLKNSSDFTQHLNPKMINLPYTTVMGKKQTFSHINID